VPVLSRGDKYTFGQSTKQIVDFLGLKEKAGPELSTDELAARVDKFMGAALELIPLMPHDRLGTHVPGRPRSYRALAFHLFRVVDAFLDANEGITLVQRCSVRNRRPMPTDAWSPAADRAPAFPTGGQRRRRAGQGVTDLLRSAEPARADGHDLNSSQHVRQYDAVERGR
jgi:hypothetical protein